jgi:hypothetical protein
MKFTTVISLLATLASAIATATPVATYNSFQELSDAIFDFPRGLAYFSKDTNQWLLFNEDHDVDEAAFEKYALVDTDAAISAAESQGFSCGEISQSYTFSEPQSTVAEVLVKRVSCKISPCSNSQTCWRNGCKQCMGGNGRCFGNI